MFFLGYRLYICYHTFSKNRMWGMYAQKEQCFVPLADTSMNNVYYWMNYKKTFCTVFVSHESRPIQTWFEKRTVS